MAIYKCKVCGFIYDEEKQGKPISELTACPVCKQPVSNLLPVEPVEEKAAAKCWTGDLAYDPETARTDSQARYMAEIHEMAVTGKSIGGDRYGNYEGKLPKKNGRNWKECDIDYVKGNRNAKRIVFSNDGLIYYTGDHYKSFSKLYGK